MATSSFKLPAIQSNDKGWGPCEPAEGFKVPYQQYSKADKLGKAANWTDSAYQDRRYMNRYNSQFASGATLFQYIHEEDESSFQLVDTTRPQRPGYLRNRTRFQRNNNARRDRERREERKMETLSKVQKGRDRDRLRLQRKWQKQWYGRRWNDQPKTQLKPRQASVEIHPEWRCVHEIEFAQLSKLHFEVEPAEDLKTCGSLEYYDKSYDRVTTKHQRPLAGVTRVFHKVTSTDDPVIRKLSSEGNVFATDAILACLMSCSRSVYSWDIIAQRVGNKLFLDKRDNSQFDLLSVSETATEPPQDEGASINAPANLALEATFINQNFSQQVLKRGSERHQFAESNPFVTEDDEGEVASVGYRYRKWNLGEDITLVARCEHDAVSTTKPGGELQYMSIKTLNEWDPKVAGVDWRQKLDNQRGAVLATELKNNSCKLAKWTLSALLAGSDIIKFGYVSRVSPRDSSKHAILGTQQFNPNEFAAQITLDMSNCWGVLRVIIDALMGMQSGKYLIVKDPNKPVMRIYSIPQNTFESDDDDEEEDSEEEDDDEEEKEEEA
ncbi:eukaryotic translation initiation factor 3 subunit D-like [Sycon ciliatum]|uniref:eukaryotic translation initiation factor 3 subunit D-like n=1 Tax=Sycon ciliatum TaxID=27933 RepID=UPI0020AE2324|eukprot:scpid39479/ scgid12110/ Eukaryotic translation initiation factor 3 subunit D; Eukaryotic translation initiation factor 3 subunit 7